MVMIEGYEDLSDAQQMRAGQVPPGIYPVQLTEAAVKTSRKGDGYVSMEFTITAGDLAGSTVSDSFMLTGNGVKFGKTKVRTLLSAAGHPNPAAGVRDTEELKGLACLVEVTEKETEGQDRFGNPRTWTNSNVTNYMPFPPDGAPSAAPVQAQAPPPQGGQRPWEARPASPARPAQGQAEPPWARQQQGQAPPQEYPPEA
jgi:hypothetical protein